MSVVVMVRLMILVRRNAEEPTSIDVEISDLKELVCIPSTPVAFCKASFKRAFLCLHATILFHGSLFVSPNRSAIVHSTRIHSSLIYYW